MIYRKFLTAFNEFLWLRFKKNATSKNVKMNKFMKILAILMVRRENHVSVISKTNNNTLPAEATDEVIKAKIVYVLPLLKKKMKY